MMAHIRGPSGIGKTELLRSFLGGIRAGDDAVVLEGACHPRESLAYKALDSVIDDLSRFLMRLPDAEVEPLAPRQTASLLRVFPSSVGFRCCRPARAAHCRPSPVRFGARASAPCASCWRTSVRVGSCWSGSTTRNGETAIALCCCESLSAARSAAMPAAALLSRRRVGRQPVAYGAARRQRRAAVARERARGRTPRSQGDPHAGRRAARGAPTGGREIAARGGRRVRGVAVLRRRAGPLPGIARPRRLAQRPEHRRGGPRASAGTVGARPRSPRAGRDLRRTHSADFRPAARRAEPRWARAGARSLRAVPAAPRDVARRGPLDTYHDRIRDTVLTMMDDSARRGRHRELADGLRAQPSPDAQLLVQHYLGAGEEGLAGEYAVPAASAAEAALAFDRATELYGLALRLRHGHDPDFSIRIKRAEALASAGRYADSGEVYEEAAVAAGEAAPSVQTKSMLRGRAAEQYLYGGYLARGMLALRDVLRDLGEPVPPTPAAARRSALALRLRFVLRGTRFRLPMPRPFRRTRFVRLDTLWRASKGTAMLDHSLSDLLVVRHLLGALRIGEPSRALRALGMEANIEASIGGRWLSRRSERILETAATRSQHRRSLRRRLDFRMPGHDRLLLGALGRLSSALRAGGREVPQPLCRRRLGDERQLHLRPARPRPPGPNPRADGASAGAARRCQGARRSLRPNRFSHRPHSVGAAGDGRSGGRAASCRRHAGVVPERSLRGATLPPPDRHRADTLVRRRYTRRLGAAGEGVEVARGRGLPPPRLPQPATALPARDGGAGRGTRRRHPA